MLPFVTEGQVKKALKENSGSTPTPVPPEPTPSHPINDFTGLFNLLVSIGRGESTEGTVDETFEFNYRNSQDSTEIAESDQLNTNLFSRLRYDDEEGSLIMDALKYRVKIIFNLNGCFPLSENGWTMSPLFLMMSEEIDADTGDSNILTSYNCAGDNVETAYPSYIVGSIRIIY